jgi:hypothetical protein
MTSRNARASARAKPGWLTRAGSALKAVRPSGLRLAGSPRWIGPALKAVRPSRLRLAGRSRWLVIVPSLAALCGATAVLVYVLTSAGPPATPHSAGNASPNPDTTEAVPVFHVPAPVVPVTLPRDGAIPMSAGAAPQVKAWKAGNGGTALAAVSSEAGQVAQASGQKQYVEMKKACSELATSVSSAQDDQPIPDAAMQKQYEKALSELAQAAASCQAAITEQPEGEEFVATTQNLADLSTAAAALASGATDLYQATGQISDLGQGQ